MKNKTLEPQTFEPQELVVSSNRPQCTNCCSFGNFFGFEKAPTPKDPKELHDEFFSDDDIEDE